MILDGMPGRVEREYPLAKLTTWRIGGPAEYAYWPESWQDLAAVWQAARRDNMSLWLIGRGSNLLVPDNGLPGITIVTTGLQSISWGNHTVRVEAGYSLARLAQEAGERGWSGLEFARGIPGTVGGAIAMNAGAHGGEISGSLSRVKVLDQDGEVREFVRQELEFGYRESSVRGNAWVLEAEFALIPGDREQILSTMKENLAKRSASQPLDMPNAGSVFRNPPGGSAGRLIELAGWKGKRAGGAQVSEKHANFIVNTGEAKAADVLELIKAIQEDVAAKFGVELHPEIQYLTLS